MSDESHGGSMKVKNYKVFLQMSDGVVLERFTALKEKDFSEDGRLEEARACDKYYMEKYMLYDSEDGYYYPSFSVVKFSAQFIETVEVPE
jgi:hypothetical protein